MAKKSSKKNSIASRRSTRLRRATLDKRIAHGRFVLPTEVLTALNSTDDSRTDFDCVTELLDSDDSTTRIAAALCLEELANAWDRKSVYVQLSGTKERLFTAINDEDYKVQQHILRCLAKCHFAAADDALPALVPKLRNHVPEIQAAALVAIKSYGIEPASKFTHEIAELLVVSPIQMVQVQACRTLAMLGMDASGAIPALLTCLQQSADENVRSEVCSTLIALDPEGEQLSEIEEVDLRDRLVETLRRQGPSARAFRRSLSESWSRTKTTATDCVGFTKKELSELLQRDPKTIGRWIENGKLPIKRTKGRLIFVETDVIEQLRASLG